MEAAKVVQFVGKTLNFSGKRLFDILARLDNFGVGRIVYRNTFFNRYEEPCYYTITRVEPDMSCPTQVYLFCWFPFLFILEIQIVLIHIFLLPVKL